MTDPSIYTALLALKDPWFISSLEVDVQKQEMHVFIFHHPVSLPVLSAVVRARCTIMWRNVPGGTWISGNARRGSIANFHEPIVLRMASIA
jgi:hypothetical protein